MTTRADRIAAFLDMVTFPARDVPKLLALLDAERAEVESLRDRLARLANSVQKCATPCAQCQTLARWCTEGLGLESPT